jgi:serine/threonine protein kinase
VSGVHEQRIVHSDLKPANFLLVEGQLKLIDFGIAKAISGDTTSIARESQVRRTAAVALSLFAKCVYLIQACSQVVTSCSAAHGLRHSSSPHGNSM